MKSDFSSAFFVNSRSFQLCNTSFSSLNYDEKDQFSALIHPFLVKSRQFLEKSPDPNQSPEKTDQMGALQFIFLALSKTQLNLTLVDFDMLTNLTHQLPQPTKCQIHLSCYRVSCFSPLNQTYKVGTRYHLLTGQTVPQILAKSNIIPTTY